MPSSIQYHFLNNLIANIWWCRVIIQPLRSICLPSRTAFYSVWKSVRSTAAAPFPSITLIFELRDTKITVFFVFAALFQCNQGQQDRRVEVEETAGGPALTDRWMRTRAGEHFFLHFDQWQKTDSIKKKKGKRCQTDVTNGRCRWQMTVCESRRGWRVDGGEKKLAKMRGIKWEEFKGEGRIGRRVNKRLNTWRKRGRRLQL